MKRLAAEIMAIALMVGHGWLLPSTPAIAESSRALELRLLVPNPKSCVGSESIIAEVALRNMGRETVSIPAGGIDSAVHYSAYAPGDFHSPGLRTFDITSDPWPDQLRKQKEVILRPGESYWITGKLILDRDFFSEAGMYDVSIDFSAPRSGASVRAFTGPLESNRVYFELEDCHAENSKQ
jgi:hypothetical protein